MLLQRNEGAADKVSVTFRSDQFYRWSRGEPKTTLFINKTHVPNLCLVNTVSHLTRAPQWEDKHQSTRTYVHTHKVTCLTSLY